MFGLTLRTDCAARTKNGHAAQTQTGVARASSTSWRHAAGSNSPIAMSSRGTERAAAIQKRRLISRSSRSPSSPGCKLTVTGSSAMPQTGQEPGPSRTTSGCMGHVHLPGAA